MEREAKAYMEQGKFYEASILALVLHEWNNPWNFNSKGKRKTFCHFNYD